MIIGAALVLALVAFLGNVMYLKNVKDDAYGDAQLVQVFVVKKAIPKGTTGEVAISQDYVRSGEIPNEYHPVNAITKLDDLKQKVSIADLSPGQVVVTGQFVDPSVAQVTFAQRVPAGQVAISVSVDQVRGVAGLLLPGDKVNMLVVDSSDDNRPNVSVMYQNVNILAIGTKPAPTVGDTSEATTKTTAAATTGDTGLITFAVPLDAAQRIAYVGSALKDTSLYLTLVPPENQPLNPAPGKIDTYTGGLLTPYDKK